MSECMLDNPTTCRRERWVDGEVVAFVSFEMITQVRSIKEHAPYHYAPIEAGVIFGDPAALPPDLLRHCRPVVA